MTYFLAGLLFVLINIAAGLFGPPGFGPGLMPPFLPVAVLLLWPQYTLVFLGMFGTSFG